MTREREAEYLTRELLNYDKLQLISMLYKMAEQGAQEKVQISTGKALREWGVKEQKLRNKIAAQAIQRSMLDAQIDRE